MHHEQLWAPWRLSYIKSDPPASPPAPRPAEFLPGADPDCFICRGVAERADRENLIPFRGEKVVVVLNRFPYNNGHLLVAPLAHKDRLDELDEHEQVELQQTVTRFVGLLERLMNPEGFNIGLNLGRVAGAGLPGHLHWHIVPRWNGDTNFMAVLGAVDVIPQSLDALWTMLTEALQSHAQAAE